MLTFFFLIISNPLPLDPNQQYYGGFPQQPGYGQRCYAPPYPPQQQMNPGYPPPQSLYAQPGKIIDFAKNKMFQYC